MITDPVPLAQSLIRCASVTPEDDGAQAVLKKFLKPLGFDIHNLPFEGNGSYPVKNFFARLGTAGPHLCFCGHTDVVPAGDEAAWTHPPFSAKIDDGKLYGRGASDMKGNIAAFAAAVADYLDGQKTPKGSISFLITGDEEADSINGTEPVLRWMKENGHTPDVCLVGEPTNPSQLGQEVKIGRRGSLSGEITLKGKQGHVAYPDLADNPLAKLAHVLDMLSRYVFDMGSAFFPRTNLEITTIDVGNPAHNVIPAEGKATFNIRFSDRWTRETLSEKLYELLDATGYDYHLHLWGNAESFLTQPGEWTHLVAESVEAETGLKPKLTTNGGTSDARFIASYCPVVEFGLTNATVHQVDEHLAVDDLRKLTEIYRSILIRYFA